MRSDPRREEAGNGSANSPSYMATMADAVADAKRIVERIESGSRKNEHVTKRSNSSNDCEQDGEGAELVNALGTHSQTWT